MKTLIPQSFIFFEEECTTGCEEYTMHRVDEFTYDSKRHKFSCRVCCTECEQQAHKLGIKYSVTYITFTKDEWVNFLSYLGLNNPEN